MRRKLEHLFLTCRRRRIGRGCRAGTRSQRTIPVLVDRRKAHFAERPKPGIHSVVKHKAPLVYPVLQRHSQPAQNGIRMGHLNIRSIKNKVDNIPDLLEEHKLKVLFLSETWHEDADSWSIRRLRNMGFNVIETARAIPESKKKEGGLSYNNHGGLAVISQLGITVAKFRSPMKPQTFELLCCRIGDGHMPFIVAAIYRPGSSRATVQFFEELSTLFELLMNYNVKFLVTGDLNLHLERPDDGDSQRLEQILTSFNLRQRVSGSTHELGGLLDVAITPEEWPLKRVEVAMTALSDHSLICWQTPISCPCPVFKSVTRRNWTGFNCENFIIRLRESPLGSEPESGVSAADLADLFQSEITRVLDDLAPIKTVTVSTKVQRPFYDADCRAARRLARHRERVFRRKIGTPSETESRESWRAALKSSRKLVRQKGRQYWQRTLDSSTHGSSQVWRQFDKLIGPKAIRTNQAEGFTADEFHSHIDKKIQDIRSRTAGQQPPEYRHYSGPTMTSFLPPTVEEVKSIVRSSPMKQCQNDPLPTWLLVESIDTLAPFIASIIALSLHEGSVPPRWKHAVVHPHLKKPGLDQSEMANYRPVSNLPFISKLLERVVNKQLVAHLLMNDLMPRHQSAYRRGHSTETAVLRIFNDLVEMTADGRLALLGLLDMSSAFDTVNHEILIRRLQCSYGLGGSALAWLADYLNGRTQSVSWKGQQTISRPVHSGVPQGSVLGPLLFILFVADVVEVIREAGLSPHAYADDIQIYADCLPSETDCLRDKMVDAILKVGKWMEENRLMMNLSKTEFLWVSTPRRKHHIMRDPILVAGTAVHPAVELRLLGVRLDETLSFVGHIGQLTGLCYYQLRRIKEVRRYLPTSTTAMLVRAMVLQRIDYCNSVLLGLPETQLGRLQRVMNASVRLIYRLRSREHVTPLLKNELHWLKVPERITYKRCMLSFRALHDPTCPEYLSTLLHRQSLTERCRQLRSSSRVLLAVPRPAKTPKFGERSVVRGNPRLWNALPDIVTSSNSYDQFAKNLKTYLFATSYEC